MFMASQQQKPLDVSHSVLRMGFINSSSEPDIKPFSLRQYVHASRLKDISHSWPFPTKYLELCLKHGITNVLPPLEPFDSAIQSPHDGAILICAQGDEEYAYSIENKASNIVEQEKSIKVERRLYSHEVIPETSEQVCVNYFIGNEWKPEESHHFISYINSDIFLPTHKTHQHFEKPTYPKTMRHKRKKRKGRQKKRSMVDILAVAKHCTLEDLYRISRLCCGTIDTNDDWDEGSGRMPVEDNFKTKSMVKGSNKKVKRGGDDETTNNNLLSKKGRLLKIKFDGCISKIWNIN